MPDYRLLSTRHRPDGAIDTPSAVWLSASDEEDAVRQARHYPFAAFLEAADYACLVDEAGTVVCAFPVVVGRAA